jgi:hypothetical protein
MPASICQLLKRSVLLLMLVVAIGAMAQKSEDDRQDQHLDVRSSAGDLHLGNDVDARGIGLPVYPGARIHKHDTGKDNANLSILTEAFGFKLLVANYDSDDSSEKVIAFYRDKLKRYGKVLECHTQKIDSGIDINTDDHDSHSNELKCEGDNKGNVLELKAGTQDNQHVVAIEPGANGKGATFALVYVHARGKQADI